MNRRIVLMLSALTLFASHPCARAATFDDLWLTRIKPPPYGGVATEFDDTIAFDGKRLFVGDGALHRVLIWNSLPASDNEPANAVLGQPSFTSLNMTDVPGPARFLGAGAQDA